ncbi:MAG: NAD(P)/FAD-dependent oxidoreductase [Bryobacterales bacterium]|nr:NAD(P)/FAD-dependent oxidoreductase [Bryobacterales bacterium]MBV9398722.1 NAD(P)/FAD-dependent oxidoreductase [Bryobacterales bacterium]
MDSCDVLIVGGGPAGSSCAWALRQSGLDVLLLDKQVFPRDKVCGGWITPRVLQVLGIDASDYARGRVLQSITGFRVGSIGSRPVETDYGRPVSYGIRRCEFDDYLLRRSRARLRLGESLIALERSGAGWIANGAIQARMVVGAGGHFCPVARLTGAKPAGEPAVVAQETEFEMDAEQIVCCRIRSETPELYFSRDMKGYGWCFRKGNFLNIGLGRADQHQLSTHVGAFLEFLKSAERTGFDIPSPRGHAYLLHGYSQRKVADDSVLLIGDAAGLAYPQSGEGILPAIESGLLAAQAIIAAQGHYAREQFEPYRSRIANGHSPLLVSIARHIPAPAISAAARQLLRTQWFVRQVVLDDWFLHISSQLSVVSDQFGARGTDN